MGEEEIKEEDLNWENVAKSILEKEKILKHFECPVPIFVLAKHKDDIYIGSIQYIGSEFSKEIVLLSKSNYVLTDSLVREIKKIDKDRLELIVDESLDIRGRQHILRVIGNRLERMSQEQTEYMIDRIPNIVEI